MGGGGGFVRLRRIRGEQGHFMWRPRSGPESEVFRAVYLPFFRRDRVRAGGLAIRGDDTRRPETTGDDSSSG